MAVFTEENGVQQWNGHLAQVSTPPLRAIGPTFNQAHPAYPKFITRKRVACHTNETCYPMHVCDADLLASVIDNFISNGGDAGMVQNT